MTPEQDAKIRQHVETCFRYLGIADRFLAVWIGFLFSPARWKWAYLFLRQNKLSQFSYAVSWSLWYRASYPELSEEESVAQFMASTKA